MKTINISEGSEDAKTFVNYRLEQLGRDWVLYITGGEAHLGSIACSESDSSSNVWQITLKNHKEDVIVRNATQRLKAVLPGEILVIGGIHYDQINRRQIQQIVENCELILERLVTILTTEN